MQKETGLASHIRVKFGKWTIIETNAGTGYGFIKTSYQPLTEININFQPNGLITLSGLNQGLPIVTYGTLIDTKYCLKMPSNFIILIQLIL